MATPLPDNTFTGALFIAYERCKVLEADALAVNTTGPNRGLKGRVLGYLLIHAPTEEGRMGVQTEIESCITDVQLMDLAQLYIDHFIRIFKRTAGSTLLTSSDSSRSSLQKQGTLELLEEATKKHTTAKELALRRDNNRCLVTGKLNSNAYFLQVETDPTLEGVLCTVTQASHILPDCLGQHLKLGNHESSRMLNWVSLAWDTLGHSGQDNMVSDQLNERDIHHVDNIMTLDMTVHTLFDQLILWFEPEGDIPNQYRVCLKREINLGLPNPPVVTFTSSDPRIPLPNARFLKLHAACVKVANLSGASEYIESMLRDVEEIEVLASDGTSADVLEFALARSSIC
ncbi:hypothetical protein FRB95_008348 [Tulasnella sp. JGI-2019a]|nr:hypothetical protein FRB95_008348 [Tulasnella sp. JGI-2019a]